MAANAKWIAKSQAELAEACGVSLATIAHWARLGMPGKQGRYDLREVFRWSRTVGPCSHTKQKADPDDQLLAEGGDSPGLERYRLAKAALAELELEERKGSLLSREKVRGALIRWASIVRRLGELLAKRFGNEASGAINNALVECQRVTDDEFGGGESTDDGAAGGTFLGAVTCESADSSDNEPVG